MKFRAWVLRGPVAALSPETSEQTVSPFGSFSLPNYRLQGFSPRKCLAVTVDREPIATNLPGISQSLFISFFPLPTNASLPRDSVQAM